MATQQKIKLGELLVRAGVIDEMQLQAALAQQKKWGGRLGRHITEMGFSDSRTISRALAKQLGLPSMDPSRESVDLKLLDKFPERVALEACALPFRTNEKTVAVVMADPTNLILFDDLERRFGKRIQVHVAAEQTVTELIDRAYRALEYGESMLPPTAPDASIQQMQGVETQAVPPPPPEPEPATAVESADDLDMDASLDALRAAEEAAERAARARAAPAPQPKAPARPQPAPQPGAPAPEVATDLRQVLLFEADAAERRELRVALRHEGYEVREADSLNQVTQQLGRELPAVLVLEVSDRDLKSVELARKLKGSNAYGQIPVVLTSAHYQGWRAQADLQELSGADAVLFKPVGVYRLAATFDRILGRRGMRPNQQEAERLLHQGRQLLEQGDLEEAIASLERAAEFDETNFEIFVALGNAFETKQETFRTLIAYERAAELEAGNFLIFKKLSLAYERLGFKRKAYEAYERSARHCPNPQLKERIKQHMASLL